MNHFKTLLSLVFAVSLLNCGEKTLIEDLGQCTSLDGVPVNCETGLPFTPEETPEETSLGIPACGTEFDSTFIEMLKAESSLDGWIHHCEAFGCNSGAASLRRSAAERLTRSAQTLKRNFSRSVCTGSWRGGNNHIEGQVEGSIEADRAIAKASRYLS